MQRPMVLITQTQYLYLSLTKETHKSMILTNSVYLIKYRLESKCLKKYVGRCWVFCQELLILDGNNKLNFTDTF